MKSLLCMTLSCAAAVAAAAQTSGVAAQQPATVAVRSAAEQSIATGSPDNFSGLVQITTPFLAPAPGRAGGGTVTFAPGARTAWHTHPLGQTLIVTEGLGLVQQRGQSAHVIRPGDVVTIPANVLHWHGAGADAAMTHVAIAEKENGVSVTWKDKVSDQDYLAAVNSVLGGAALSAKGSEKPGTVRKVLLASESLSARQQSIPLMAAVAATSDMPKLNAALHRALDAGLSINEAKEILVQLYAYAGFPKSLNALGELQKVVQARQQKGIQDAIGREPSRRVATGEALLVAGKANQTEISGGPVQGPVFEFAPVINQFLQAHLFGDIFERDNLDWPSRELATVGILAATPGAEAQLRSHMRASLRVGLTAGQLRQLVQLLVDDGQTQAAQRADTALTQALAAASKE